MAIKKVYSNTGSLLIEYRPNKKDSIFVVVLLGLLVIFILSLFLDNGLPLIFCIIFIPLFFVIILYIVDLISIDTIEITKQSIISSSKPLKIGGRTNNLKIALNDIESFNISTYTFPKGDMVHRFNARLFSGEDKTIFYLGENKVVTEIFLLCREFTNKL